MSSYHWVFVLAIVVALHFAFAPLVIVRDFRTKEPVYKPILIILGMLSMLVTAVFLFMSLGNSYFAEDSAFAGGALPRGAVLENLHTVEYHNLPAENEASLGNYSILKFPNGKLYSYRLNKKPPDGCFMVEDTPTGTNFRKLPCTE